MALTETSIEIIQIVISSNLAEFSNWGSRPIRTYPNSLDQWESKRVIWKRSWYFEEFEVLIPPCPAIKNLFLKRILELNQPMGNIEEFLQLAFIEFQPIRFRPIRVRQKSTNEKLSLYKSPPAKCVSYIPLKTAFLLAWVFKLILFFWLVLTIDQSWSVKKPFLVLDDLISHRENLFHVHQKD